MFPVTWDLLFGPLRESCRDVELLRDDSDIKV